jgi:hypothetical protein
LYDRKRLTDRSRCGWESLKAYFTSYSKPYDAMPGAVIAIQTFGDLLGGNPHLHVRIFDIRRSPSGLNPSRVVCDGAHFSIDKTIEYMYRLINK